MKEDELSDSYDSAEDWYKRTTSGRYRDEAIARRRSMPYKPEPHDRDAPDEFAVIPPGVYGAVVEGLALKYSQEQGNPYVAWSYTIAEGEWKNRMAWNNTSLLKKSVNMPGGWYKSITAAMNDSGIYADEVAGSSYDDEEGMTEIVAHEVVGRLVTLAISNRMFEGNKQTDVKAVKPYEGDLPQLDLDEREEAKGPPAPKKGRKTKTAKAKKDDF